MNVESINLYVFRNASYDNLQYLTIEQALSDISYLIGDATEHLEAPNAKVIVWGTGYGGTLAALARDKYPHLIDGAWSSSGIFALSPVTDGTRRDTQLLKFA